MEKRPGRYYNRNYNRNRDRNYDKNTDKNTDNNTDKNIDKNIDKNADNNIDAIDKKESDVRERKAEVKRVTSETDIFISLNLDGTGQSEVSTGIGFFDHMLISFAKHGLFDLKVKVKGDLQVDCHHTIEDTGIVLGQAIKEAVGDKKQIKRYGSALLPMDEALILCALDLSGRPYLVFDAEFTTDRVGYFDTEMVKEFFYAVSYASAMNLHIKEMAGANNHHIIEGMFKAFAKALDQATIKDERIKDLLSTKGAL